MGDLNRRIKLLIKNTFPYFCCSLMTKYKVHKAKNVKDKKELCLKTYKKKFGVDLDLENPVRFYDKINYLRLFWTSDKASEIVDKGKVKEFLSKSGYEKNLVKQIKIYDTYSEFVKDFKTLISQYSRFVIKLTHTSGDVFFYNNKKWTDKRGYRVRQRYVFARLKYRVDYNYYYDKFETIYKNVKGRILVEEYLPSISSKGLSEFKFFCNYGKPILINYVEGRQDKSKLTECFLTPELKNTHFSQDQKTFDFESLDKPVCYNQMIDFCKKTCSDLPFVRVDLMLLNDSFIFGEFTFFDCAGYNIFRPMDANYSLGELIDISEVIKNSL